MLLKRNLLGITLFSLIISLICFCLSAWQVKRLFWKSDLINSLELAYKSSPANINNLYGDLREFKYKKILVEGTFINKNMYLEPRTYNAQVGFNLISPFLLKDGRIILINRGWVREKKFFNDDNEKNVFLQGILKESDKKNFFTPKNVPKDNSWFYINILQMSKYVGFNLINYVFLELINENDLNNYPIAKEPKVALPNNHLQYSITWGMLAVIFLIMNYIYLRKNK